MFTLKSDFSIVLIDYSLFHFIKLFESKKLKNNNELCEINSFGQPLLTFISYSISLHKLITKLNPTLVKSQLLRQY